MGRFGSGQRGRRLGLLNRQSTADRHWDGSPPSYELVSSRGDDQGRGTSDGPFSHVTLAQQRITVPVSGSGAPKRHLTSALSRLVRWHEPRQDSGSATLGRSAPRSWITQQRAAQAYGRR